MRNKRSDVMKRVFSVISLLIVLMPLFFTPATTGSSPDAEIKDLSNYSVTITGQQVINTGYTALLYVRVTLNEKAVVDREVRLTCSNGSVEKSIANTDANGIARFRFDAYLGLSEGEKPLKVVFSPAINMVEGDLSAPDWYYPPSDFCVTVYPPDIKVVEISLSSGWAPSVSHSDIANKGIALNMTVGSYEEPSVSNVSITVKIIDQSGGSVFSERKTTDLSGRCNVVMRYPDAPKSGDFLVEITTNKTGYEEDYMVLPLLVSPHSMNLNISFIPTNPKTGDRVTVLVTTLDSDTGLPVKGARVIINYDDPMQCTCTIGSQKEGITNSSGQFSTDIETWSHQYYFYVSVSAAAEDYATAHGSNSVSVTYYNSAAAAKSASCLSLFMVLYLIIIIIALVMFKRAGRKWYER